MQVKIHGLASFSQDVPPALMVHSLTYYWRWPQLLLSGTSLGNYHSSLYLEKTHTFLPNPMTEVRPASASTLSRFCVIVGYSSQHLALHTTLAWKTNVCTMLIHVFSGFWRYTILLGFTLDNSLSTEIALLGWFWNCFFILVTFGSFVFNKLFSILLLKWLHVLCDHILRASKVLIWSRRHRELFSTADDATGTFLPWIVSPGKSMLPFVQNNFFSPLDQK